MKILNLFTLPHVVPNMYDFFSSAEHKIIVIIIIISIVYWSLFSKQLHWTETKKTIKYKRNSYNLCAWFVN